LPLPNRINVDFSFNYTNPVTPSTMSRLLPRKVLRPSHRYFTTSTSRLAFATGPAPPRLPPKEQEEFERLQRSSTGAFSTPRGSPSEPFSDSSSPSPHASLMNTRPHPQINQSPHSSTAETADTSPSTVSEKRFTEKLEEQVEARVKATGKGEELHPDIRRGAKPEFEGDRNPKTGETGGPKNEPLRWGSTGERGDWSYNGRVTDF